ncbi:ABC transporter substrate-binding protein [Pendulispora rubella]|uniref:ABC transporter substrate-binding protein n=1 Tax=Pendulispora rubella TaxID=2741070 RepID=A0ABZ2KWL5_9BACT
MIRTSAAVQLGSLKRKLLTGALAVTAFAASSACISILGVDDLPAMRTDASTSDAATSDATDFACGGNADCFERYGENWICRPSSQRCVNLVSTECPRVIGNSRDNNAVIFGSILPLMPPYVRAGQSMVHGIELGILDFELAGRLPPVPGKFGLRPIVVVSCMEDWMDQSVSLRAARHLVDDVGVPAIIGPGSSPNLSKVATDVAIPRGVLLVSPYSTSRSLTQLPDDGLVWRTAPSAAVMTNGLVALMPLVEQESKSHSADTAINVAVVSAVGSYEQGLANALIPRLTFNGAPASDHTNSKHYTRINHEYGSRDISATIAGLLSFKPHVAFVLAMPGEVQRIITEVEKGWPSSLAYRPLYLLADENEKATISSGLAGLSRDSQKRILGTKVGGAGDTFAAFVSAYLARIHDGTLPDDSFAANAYDALYNLAYSTVALGAEPLTGRGLARGFAKQISGSMIPAGPGNISAALERLLAGETFDYDGASGPLDFDVATGEAPANVPLWCVGSGDGSTVDVRTSSVHYSAKLGKLTGSLAEIRATCNP